MPNAAGDWALGQLARNPDISALDIQNLLGDISRQGENFGPAGARYAGERMYGPTGPVGPYDVTGTAPANPETYVAPGTPPITKSPGTPYAGGLTAAGTPPGYTREIPAPWPPRVTPAATAAPAAPNLPPGTRAPDLSMGEAKGWWDNLFGKKPLETAAGGPSTAADRARQAKERDAAYAEMRRKRAQKQSQPAPAPAGKALEVPSLTNPAGDWFMGQLSRNPDMSALDIQNLLADISRQGANFGPPGARYAGGQMYGPTGPIGPYDVTGTAPANPETYIAHGTPPVARAPGTPYAGIGGRTPAGLPVGYRREVPAPWPPHAGTPAAQVRRDIDGGWKVVEGEGGVDNLPLSVAPHPNTGPVAIGPHVPHGTGATVPPPPSEMQAAPGGGIPGNAGQEGAAVPLYPGDSGRAIWDLLYRMAHWSDEGAARARAYTGSAEASMQPAARYYQRILSGNPADMAEALGPAFRSTAGQFDQAQQAAAMNLPRGGGRNQIMAEQPFNRARAMADLVPAAQAQAAGASGELGSRYLAAVAQQLQAATGLTGQALEQLVRLWITRNAQQSGAGTAASGGIGQLIGSILGALI